jgi:hypothetical protein
VSQLLALPVQLPRPGSHCPTAHTPAAPHDAVPRPTEHGSQLSPAQPNAGSVFCTQPPLQLFSLEVQAVAPSLVTLGSTPGRSKSAPRIAAHAEQATSARKATTKGLGARDTRRFDGEESYAIDHLVAIAW